MSRHLPRGRSQLPKIEVGPGEDTSSPALLPTASPCPPHLARAGPMPPQPGQLHRRPPQVEAGDGAEQVHLDPLDPAERHPGIAPEGQPDPGARRRRPQPAAVIGEVLADRGRRQRGADPRRRVQHRGDEGVGIRPRPGPVVAMVAPGIAGDGRLHLRDQGGGRVAVGGEDHLRAPGRTSGRPARSRSVGSARPRRCSRSACSAWRPRASGRSSNAPRRCRASGRCGRRRPGPRPGGAARRPAAGRRWTGRQPASHRRCLPAGSGRPIRQGAGGRGKRRGAA